MKIFKNKTKKYRIYCYLDKTAQVRELAEKYAAKNTVVETRAHGCLLKDNIRVTVAFDSTEQEPTIYKAMLEAFNGYHIEIIKKSIFIYKEIGLN
jgi:hypothetical protein